MSIGVRDRPLSVTVVGAGVVGCAVALALARRGAEVTLVEAQADVGLSASGTNSGIWHTGFDSVPGELETELILRSAALRDDTLRALGVPLLRCGAVMRGHSYSDNARQNGVEVEERGDELFIPGESVTDPVAYTRALASAAERHGAELRTGTRDFDTDGLVVNCAGLYADEVARSMGDDSFEIYPRKGEFLVFDPPEPLDRIRLPVPTARTKGVLVFPTLDGHVVAGPTAVDGADKEDWSVRPGARDEILPKAAEMWPPLAGLEPVAMYAGLRPAGRGMNYVIGRSPANDRLINVAAIRSTGLTASLGIADYVCDLLGLGDPEPLKGGDEVASTEWWRRTAELRAS